MRIEAEQLINDKKINKYILRLPFVEDVYKYYFVSDIVVSPFIIAHFSRAVIEAGIMQKPVIASKMDVIMEVLEDGYNGLLVNPNDAQDLADKIIYLIQNKKIAAELGMNGKKESINYDPIKYSQKIKKLYFNSIT